MIILCLIYNRNSLTTIALAATGAPRKQATATPVHVRIRLVLVANKASVSQEGVRKKYR